MHFLRLIFIFLFVLSIFFGIDYYFEGEVASSPSFESSKICFIAIFLLLLVGLFWALMTIWLWLPILLICSPFFGLMFLLLKYTPVSS